MKTKADIRRENVRDIIKNDFNGVVKNFADAVGKTAAQISNVTRDKNPSNIGEKVARLIEQKLGKPSGFLDLDQASNRDEGLSSDLSTEQIKFLSELKEVKDRLVYLEVKCAESDSLVTIDFYNDLRNSLYDVSYSHRTLSEMTKRNYYNLITEQFLNWYDLNGKSEIAKVNMTGIDPSGYRINRHDLLFEVFNSKKLEHYIEVFAHYGSNRRQRASDRFFTKSYSVENEFRLDKAYMIRSEHAITFLYIPEGYSLNQIIGHFYPREEAVSLARKIQQFEKFSAYDLDKIKSNQNFYDYLLSPFQNTEIFK